MPKGSWREAEVAGPPSPEVVGLPLPAMVVISAAREGAVMKARARRRAGGRGDMGRADLILFSPGRKGPWKREAFRFSGAVGGLWWWDEPYCSGDRCAS